MPTGTSAPSSRPTAAPRSSSVAIDFYRLTAEGHQFAGDSASKKDYAAYGAEVLAVADGRIAAVVNDQPENETPHPSRRSVPITLETIGGNYVMLEVAPSRYVFYAHLQTGSVRVKVGDRVRRGQVLGLLGLSGNTPAPHLHLHLGDTIEPLGSEGFPTCSTNSKWWASARRRPHRGAGRPAARGARRIVARTRSRSPGS
ncbi:MAG: M23 family metallopeptidase [Gemmatimonadales bacterium]